jgi:glucuronoarabinoxylan endo-1,4-beta-xylanase
VPIDVDLTQTLQRIDGFGASSAWTTTTLSDAMADTLFSADLGVGLSLLRLRIAPDGTTAEMATAQKAFARGARVWAAPWSPPAAWKTNNNLNEGGSLLDAHRQDWANQLAAFAGRMAAAGVPLLGLSAQNEPNFAPPMTATQKSWESCIYTPAQLVAFVRDYLGPALRTAGLATPILAPESQDWTSFDGFAGAFAADSAAMNYLGPFAAHAYGGAPHTLAAVTATGNPVWETEISDKVKTHDTGIDSGLRIAQMMHDNLVNGGVSAWHYWWITPGGLPMDDTNGALTFNGQPTRRVYAMGNWSKFVRPGFVRVAATPIPQSSVFASAFSDPATGRVVIVVVNALGSAVDQGFTIAGGTASTLTPWTTSATLALVAGDPVAVTDGAFTYTLPARSVTSLVSGP